jgi:hypothetical protein
MMSDSQPQQLIIDDERFDNLVDAFEVLVATFFRETLADSEVEFTDEEVEAELEVEVEAAVGSFLVVLTALNAQILSTSKNEKNEEAFEIKLTVPNGDIREVIRRVIDELGSEEID